MNYKGEYVEAPTYPGSVSRRCPNISKSIKCLNYSPQISWENGLEKSVAWYSDYYKLGKPIYSGGFKAPEELAY